MRILYVCNDLVGGGAQKLLYDLLPLIKQKNNSVCLLVLNDKNDKYSEKIKKYGIKVKFVPRSIKGKINISKYIAFYADKMNIDIVHANLFPTFYCCALSKILSKKKFRLVMTEHNTDNKRRHIPAFRPVERIVYGCYDTVISISDETQNNLTNWIGSKKNKRFTVIYNGVNTELFNNATAYKKGDFFSNHKEEYVYIAVVGSFTEQKNHIGMLDIIKRLPEKYKLVLVGEGKLQEIIHQKVDELGLSHRVIFLGFRYDVAEIMRTVDIIAIPSKWEGFGLIAVEAMACGKPTIAFDVDGLSNVIGDAGIKIPVGDNNLFAKKIMELTGDTYKEYSKKAQQRAKMFDIQIMADKYCNVYERLMR